MARKSSGFKELLAEKKASQDKFRMLERIKRRSQSGDDGGLVKDVIIDPEGQEKMSDIMNRFLEPYLDTVDSLSEYKNLLTIGALAWNASVVAEDKQEEALDLISSGLLANAPEDVQEDMYLLIDELIERKNKYFAAIKRFIIDFTARDTGREYHLSVVSSVIDDEDDDEN